MRYGVGNLGDPGVALSRAYDILRQEESQEKALSFVTDVNIFK
jgi:hypothetical protein